MARVPGTATSIMISTMYRGMFYLCLRFYSIYNGPPVFKALLQTDSHTASNKFTEGKKVPPTKCMIAKLTSACLWQNFLLQSAQQTTARTTSVTDSSHLRCTGVKGTGFTNADLISVLGICGRDWMSMSSNISLFHANKKQFLLRFDIYGAAVQKEEAACLNVQKR